MNSASKGKHLARQKHTSECNLELFQASFNHFSAFWENLSSVPQINNIL